MLEDLVRDSVSKQAQSSPYSTCRGYEYVCILRMTLFDFQPAMNFLGLRDEEVWWE